MEFLGIPPQGDTLEFPLTEQDLREFNQIPEFRSLKAGRYACIHPGSRMLSRRWLPERFAAVADALAVYGFTAVITGTPEETTLAGMVLAAMKTPGVMAAGKTTLGALAVLVKGAGVVVSNDTGISHIAAALDAPSVVIVTGSDPGRWQPSPGKRRRVVYHPLGCRPCSHVECPAGHPCAIHVETETVLDAVDELLREECNHAPEALERCASHTCDQAR